MYFTLDDYEIMSKMGDDFQIDSFGQSMKNFWKTPNAQFLTSDDGPIKIPNISNWIPRALVFDEKAHNLLLEHLEDYGEMLGINIDSNKYYMFNLMRMTDNSTIDYDKSQKAIFQGEQVGIKRLVFKNDLIDDDLLLFTTSYDRGANIFCGDKFKNLVEELELTGITFDTMLAIDPLEGLEDLI